MKALIVDDEQLSHNVLIDLLEKGHTDIDVLASGHCVEEGITLINAHQPDLIFLDIEMPDGTGFDLLNRIGNPKFHVVFITAHNVYAQDAIRFGALDYLLKPIGTEELSEALGRARQKQEEKVKQEQWRMAYEAFHQFQRKELPSRMTVSTLEGIHFIPVKDIIRFQADGNTTDIYIKNRKRPLIASVNIGEYVKQFDAYENFMKVHRSHLVNLSFVDLYSKTDGGFLVMEDGAQVAVSRKTRENLLLKLSKL